MKYEPDPEVIARLREYNRWRRGDEKIAQPDPGKIGRLLDTVCEMVGQLERERDEARQALSKIDEIFCDGEDTHDDWMKMGNIAKDYFKGLE